MKQLQQLRMNLEAMLIMDAMRTCIERHYTRYINDRKGVYICCWCKFEQLSLMGTMELIPKCTRKQ